MNIKMNSQGQAVAPQSVNISQKAFDSNNKTSIYWMGSASIMIHSHHTNIMIDPLLKGFDLPLLIDMPILPKDIPHLDGVLITHIDNDHFSVPTCLDLANVTDVFHAPYYVATKINELNLNGIGHDIGDSFDVNDIRCTLTKASHNWQNHITKYQYRHWHENEYCGYWIETKEGTIWLPGDSKLLPDHLTMPQPDVILFDFADNEWHITLEGAITLANAYPNSDLICIHWGSVDAPDMSPFNGNPQTLIQHIKNPERLKVLAPGEEYVLQEK